MASIVRWYIFRKALAMTLAALVSLILLMVVSELFGKLTTFAEYDTGLPTILLYLAYSVPQMIHWILPFSVCLGILAAQAAFSRHSEIIAMQSCSVSLAQIYIPYLIVGLLATLLMASTSFYIYPSAQRQADRIENLHIKKTEVAGSFTLSGGRFKVGQDIYIVNNLNITLGVMENITCYRFSSGRLVQVIRAESARWDGNVWLAQGMEVFDLSEEGISEARTATILPLDRKPEDLIMAETKTEVLPLPELRKYLQQLRADGVTSPATETLYYSRISFALAPFIIAVLVIPFGMRFPRAGGIARGISLGLVLGLSYWFLHSSMTGLGASGVIHPLIASWSANAAALILALFILIAKRRAVYG
ncbi:MAG TPA: LptF/LptG family permease [Deltaproteobacteria bacterium]|nr:LptF/LptG family permease [Deltaproteobacteria bacterium]MDI9543869.1 LptF/LptG family permease [Pseudomonadota bacterium]HQO80785.1 LptF/LptG family permease [Deltaproteobacteria bacterium]